MFATAEDLSALSEQELEEELAAQAARVDAGRVRAATAVGGRGDDLRGVARLALLAVAAAGTRARADRPATCRAAPHARSVLARRALVREGERADTNRPARNRGAAARARGGDDRVAARARRGRLQTTLAGGGSRTAGARVLALLLDRGGRLVDARATRRGGWRAGDAGARGRQERTLAAPPRRSIRGRRGRAGASQRRRARASVERGGAGGDGRPRARSLRRRPHERRALPGRGSRRCGDARAGDRRPLRTRRRPAAGGGDRAAAVMRRLDRRVARAQRRAALARPQAADDLTGPAARVGGT